MIPTESVHGEPKSTKAMLTWRKSLGDVKGNGKVEKPIIIPSLLFTWFDGKEKEE